MAGRISLLWAMWHECNRRWFGGKLAPPDAIVITRARSYHGKLQISWDLDDGVIYKQKIFISSHAKDILGTMLHEMIHQYQVTILRVDPEDHGGVFRCYAKWLERETSKSVR